MLEYIFVLIIFNYKINLEEKPFCIIVIHA